MNKYDIGEKVIFVWNFSEFPGIIREICNSGIYKVEFSPHIAAGSYQTIRDICEGYLRKNESYQEINLEKKIIIRI
jgi:hypothetical protein